MTPEVQIALIGLVGVFITAVVAPPVVAIVNHLITTRNESRKKGLEVAEAQDRKIKSQAVRIRSQDHEIRRLRRRLRTGATERPRTGPSRTLQVNPARKGSRP